MADVMVTDLYGFNVKLRPGQAEERAECDANQLKAEAIWSPIVESQKLPPEPRLKELVRKGVPPPCRPWVWLETSGANAKRAKFANNYYSIMIQAGQKSPFLKEIETDSTHTFPNHAWLQSADGQAALRNVLLAYSVHNDKVGYVRSMNTVAALLLVVLSRNEESTFWLLAALVEDILHPGTYSRHLEGCQVEMRALEELAAAKLPRLYEHFRKLEVDISIIATDWFLCLFSTSLPPETVARAWDALFFEGPKILFRVALALLKLYETPMLHVDNAGELMMRMRNAAATMHQRDALMATAFEGIGGLPMATIDKLRDLKAKEVEAVLRARETGGPLPESAAAGSAVLTSDVAAEKLKAGFGKFMGGLTKLADKAADKMAKLTVKEKEEAAAAAAAAGGAAGATAAAASPPKPQPQDLLDEEPPVPPPVGIQDASLIHNQAPSVDWVQAGSTTGPAAPTGQHGKSGNPFEDNAFPQ